MSGIALHMYRLSYRVSDLYTLGFGENGLGLCLHILTLRHPRLKGHLLAHWRNGTFIGINIGQIDGEIEGQVVRTCDE